MAHDDGASEKAHRHVDAFGVAAALETTESNNDRRAWRRRRFVHEQALTTASPPATLFASLQDRDLDNLQLLNTLVL